MRKIEDVCPVSEEKITDIAEALTLAASLKEGTLAELKELIAQQMIDKMVEWEVDTFKKRRLAYHGGGDKAKRILSRADS